MTGKNAERPNVIVLAYACRPDMGSEPGAGWGMVMAINEVVHPIVLISPGDKDVIDQWLQTATGPVPEFIVVDEPWWARFVQSNRFGWFATYLAWVPRAETAAVDLIAERDIDAAHHVTYSSYWLPSPVGRLVVPSIWGPVGGAVVTPKSLLRFLGRRGRIGEIIDKVVVRMIERLPSVRWTWKQVTLRVVQNTETLERIQTETKRTTVVFNHASVHEFDPAPLDPDRDTYALWLSALESRKGPELAIRAMAATDDSVHLKVAGDGPERARMESLAADLGVADRIEFLGRVAHGDAIDLVRNAAVAVYTGMREEGGLAFTEALLSGTPTIVLDNGGPAAIARAVTDPEWVALIDTSSADAAVAGIAQAMERFTATERPDRAPLLDRSQLIEDVAGMYDAVLIGPDFADGIFPLGDHGPSSQLEPEVSIVMPAYNASAFIGEAIESLLDQTFANFELIIIENGSSDDTRGVIEEYAAKDARIRGFGCDRRLGVVRPPMFGMANARAELVGRLDADDLAMPDRLARQVGFLEEHPDVVVVGSNARHVSTEGEILGLMNAGPTSVDDFQELYRNGELTFVLDGTSLMRKSVYDKVGGYDSLFVSAPEVDLHCRMAEHGAIVAFQDPLMSYRLHGASNVDSVFFEGRKVHRYIAYRQQTLRTGGEPMSFPEFVAREHHDPVLGRTRRWLSDVSQYQYRSAGTSLALGDTVGAAFHGVLAAASNPSFALRRLWDRRLSRSARDTMRRSAGPDDGNA